MSDSSAAAASPNRRQRLPQWARPLDSERRGLGSLRLAETTILILLALLLAIATVNDVVRQTHVNHRLIADLRTWRAVTGHNYKDIGIEQDIKTHTTTDIACGNVSPGAPKQRTQLCLRLAGPIVAGRRALTGGYYLPPYSEDESRLRYGCFGSAVQAGLCRH